MSRAEAVEERIVMAVARFEQEQMSLSPTSILASLQTNTLFVILEGLTLEAERACTEDEQKQGLFEQYHARVFDASRHLLEPEIEDILGRKVERSTMRVEPVSGTGTMQFTLGHATEKK